MLEKSGKNCFFILSIFQNDKDFLEICRTIMNVYEYLSKNRKEV
jgi:hypothetical protein